MGEADLYDRRLDFPFHSGRPCLDFAGTMGRRGHHDIERIATGDHVKRWGVEAGLLPPDGAPVPVTEHTARQARALRESIYRAVRAKMAGTAPHPEDTATVNRWARRAPLPLALSADGRGLDWAGTESVLGMLASLARDAVELLTGVDALRLRECAGPTCTVIFLDQSRTNNRRWCSMDLCGNRDKKASFRRKERINKG
ncbi:CGNR zinc finger domain-containing protein [Streptomyces sp. WZ-12]|uniref:CGNR zinc finger domain-containing protein n=1 Tax=Streptomyces sp. WZ-12 TaxID=3030210 RepID=UPI0023814F31|nr:ABATE domain-containing protein [Streptomyces sp. WZ-12]